MRLGKVPGQMSLCAEVVVDLKRWNRGVPEIGVAGDAVVIDQVVVCRKWNQRLDL